MIKVDSNRKKIMTKIIGVCGSPRKNSATEYALNYALEAAGEVSGIETKLILLRGTQINPCIHCDKCVSSNKPLPRYCIHDDDWSGLMEIFVTGVGFIIGSPVYTAGMTGLLKNFLDRVRAIAYAKSASIQFQHPVRIGGSLAVGGTRHGGQEMTLLSINNFYLTYEFLNTGGPGGNYLGAALWSRAGSQDHEDVSQDAVGLSRASALGKRVAQLARIIDAGMKAVGEEEDLFTTKVW